MKNREKAFNHTIEVRWADCDANRHVRHSAYYDYGAHCRVKFLSERGFDTSEMSRLSMGPILFKEECSFLKELHLNEIMTISLLRGKISQDGSKWELHHEIFNASGDKCAHITVQGAWMDLKARKLAAPPSKLGHVFMTLPPGEAYIYKKSV